MVFGKGKHEGYVPPTVFKKGHTPWNKGLTGYITSRKGQKHTEATKRLMREKRKDQVFSEETRQKMSATKKRIGNKELMDWVYEHGAWNKGKTCPQLQGANNGMWKKKIRLNCIYCGKEVEVHPYRVDTFKFCSRACKVRHNPPHKGHSHSEETKERLSKIKTEQMKDPDLLRRCLSRRIPNTWEEWLIDLFKLHNFSFKFVGDGRVNIDGKNPDFIDEHGRIIEFFGEFWHKADEEKERIDFFASHGHPCLVVWGKDRKDEQLLVDRIAGFVGAHD